jgi:hypothetical protein
MLPSTRKLTRVLAFAAGPIAVVAAGGMVLQSSQAAFEAETRVSGNSWTTGTLTLENDSNGSAAFHVTGMIPSATEYTKCIVVTSTSNVPGTVKFYTMNPTSTPSATRVEGFINMKVETGANGSFSAGCNGFTSASTLFDGTLYGLTNSTTGAYNWSSALGAWAVTSGSKTYKFTWSFNPSAADANTVQGQSFGADFEWEMQS